MDVSITSADKQARDAAIKARQDKEASKVKRAEDRQTKKDNRRDSKLPKRLRRRIFRAVKSDLLNEKKRFLAGNSVGDVYEINVVMRYHKKNWRYKRPYIENLVREALAEHTGAEIEKLDFITKGESCSAVRIWYKLLEK